MLEWTDLTYTITRTWTGLWRITIDKGDMGYCTYDGFATRIAAEAQARKVLERMKRQEVKA